MAEDFQSSPKSQIVMKISPEVVQNKNKRTPIIKETCSAVCALLNSCHGGTFKLTSSLSLTPAALDELVRGIEQTLIEFLGLTSLRKFCQIEITELGKEIIFAVEPSDRVITVEYNLVLPTDFLVKQILRTEPLEYVGALLRTRPLDNSNLRNYVWEFQKDSTIPGDLRESDSVQFKKIKSDKNKNKSTADRIMANRITHYIAAFANHQGGHVYIGVDDETYKVCGQHVVDEEKQRILEKIASSVRSMVWPDEHGEPELGKQWDISFVPVLDANKEEIPDLYIIVISVACCPGGVFLREPESYTVDGGKVVPMGFKQWKKRLLHDAYMRDIVKFCREDSWKENSTCLHTPESEQSSGSSDKNITACFQGSAVSDSESASIPGTMPRITPRNTKSRKLCRRITDYMEQLIQDGDFNKLQSFASTACHSCKSFQEADIEVAVRFMLALEAYRRREFEEAFAELGKASSLITSTENPSEFEIQRLHLLACFRRGEGVYNESYEVTYGGLQKMEGISPGWHTAWMLNDAGYLYSILAGEERNQEVRRSLKQQAVKLYTKAIEHTSRMGRDTDETSKVVVLKSNLLHRCHLRRAMTSLDCTPLAEEDVVQKVTDAEIDVAVASILLVEESRLKGNSLTDVNECYLYLVKSDLDYRRSQVSSDYCEKYLKNSKEWAMKALDIADKDQFTGIFKYAESRLQRLSKIHCDSNLDQKLFADLDSCKECQH